MATFVGSKKLSDSERKEFYDSRNSSATTKKYSKAEYDKLQQSKSSNKPVFTTSAEAQGMSKPDKIVSAKKPTTTTKSSSKPVFTTARAAQGVSKPANVADSSMKPYPKTSHSTPSKVSTAKSSVQSGVVDVAPPKGNIFTRFGTGVAKGFTFDKEYAGEVRNNPAMQGEAVVGWALGTTAGYATVSSEWVAGKVGGGLSKGYGWVSGKTKALFGWLPKTNPGPVTTTVTQTAAGIAGGAATVKVAKETSVMTASPEQKKIMKTDSFQYALSAAYRAEEKEVNKGGFWKSAAYGVSPYFSSRKKVWQDTVRNELSKQGYSGTKLDTAVSAANRYRKSSNWGEAASMVWIGSRSEKIGRTLIGNVFRKKTSTVLAKSGGKLAARTVPAVTLAGFSEGGSSSIVQDYAREQPTDYMKAGVYGALGAATAGGIAYGISVTQVTKPVLNKVIRGAANLSDPFEVPGDKFADFTEFAARKLTGQSRPTPVVTVSGNTATFGLSGNQKTRSVTPVGATGTSTASQTTKPSGKSYTLVTSPDGSSTSVELAPTTPPTETKPTSSRSSVTRSSPSAYTIQPGSPRAVVPVNPFSNTASKTNSNSDIFGKTSTVPTEPKIDVLSETFTDSKVPGGTSDTIINNFYNTPTSPTVPTNQISNTFTSTTQTSASVFVNTGNFPILPIPDIGGTSGKRGFWGKSFKGGKSKKDYTPSLVAVAFNIRGKKPTGKLSGLGIRPVIGRSKTGSKLMKGGKY